MMELSNGVKISFYLLFTSIIASSLARSATRVETRNSEFLDKLINVKRQAPVVVFLEQSRDGLKITNALKQDLDNNQQIGNKRNSHNLEYESNYNNQDVNYVPTADEDNAYVLYNILRSTQQEEELDSKAQKTIKTTKDILRQAFALRCAARKSCEKKCPKQKCKKDKNTCEESEGCDEQEDPCAKPDPCKKKCEKKFDSFGACEEEEKPKKEEECDECDNTCSEC